MYDGGTKRFRAHARGAGDVVFIEAMCIVSGTLKQMVSSPPWCLFSVSLVGDQVSLLRVCRPAAAYASHA